MSTHSKHNQPSGAASTKLIFAFSVGAAALSGLLFGFDTAVIAGITFDLRKVFGLTEAWLGVTVSIALWGTLAGAFAVGPPGDRYGARAGLRVLALFYLLSALGCAMAWSWTAFAFSRLLGGIAALRFSLQSISPRYRQRSGADGSLACFS